MYSGAQDLICSNHSFIGTGNTLKRRIILGSSRVFQQHGYATGLPPALPDQVGTASDRTGCSRNTTKIYCLQQRHTVVQVKKSPEYFRRDLVLITHSDVVFTSPHCRQTRSRVTNPGVVIVRLICGRTAWHLPQFRPTPGS